MNPNNVAQFLLDQDQQIKNLNTQCIILIILFLLSLLVNLLLIMHISSKNDQFKG